MPWHEQCDAVAPLTGDRWPGPRGVGRGCRLLAPMTKPLSTQIGLVDESSMGVGSASVKSPKAGSNVLCSEGIRPMSERTACRRSPPSSFYCSEGDRLPSPLLGTLAHVYPSGTIRRPIGWDYLGPGRWPVSMF